MDLPISRIARERYDVREPIAAASPAPTDDQDTARRLARRMRTRRAAGAPRPPDRRQIRAMAAIHEAMHRVADEYAGTHGGESLFGSALEAIGREVGPNALDEALLSYAAEFPPPPVSQAQQPPSEYIEQSEDDRSNRARLLEELLLLWLANRNPAFMRHGELFDDWPVARASLYAEIVEGVRRHLSGTRDAGDRDLVAMLREPAQASPESLAGQLRYIRDHWPVAADLAQATTAELEAATDTDDVDTDDDEDGADEAELVDVAAPMAGIGGPGPADAQALHGFVDLTAEPERYSADLDWMPRTVLIAKSTYVWLDQLSRTYGRAIRTLDAIPDEELDRLAGQGFTGLWLIGVWSRSVASQRIKQERGNPEAVASAYSLMEYRISEDLGGEGAFADLRWRAGERGMRLAADMVPNHMGIDSLWVIDHPERFISTPDAPYPAYAFTGANLSADERVGIYLEDHYADSSDAAVVFKRVDRWSGDERYIYHGNDGTGMPWNDTAQLDFLREDVREAVIQTILAVARRAPIIRFDAAMTLARRHVQRLWYPAPNAGESIPSRAAAALDAQEFARRMPEEFWREVVDRVTAEAPDTLLLAEAFWLMEGYFVRTLGMHRVYNSAFMHMLRDEDNAEYRTVIKNTLAFDPEILKRYVNFLTNPDERSAIEQFGDHDKYFGAATMLTTLPGLPMFGHGQVEGFAERYGMEFQRARLDEPPNEGLIEHHERTIFPLLHDRSLFAGARDFALYDCVADDGTVIEDVFAYSNRDGDSTSLVVFHNRYAEVHGRIRDSAPMSVPDGDAGRTSVTTTLAAALGLPDDADSWLILRDFRSGQEWLRSSREIFEDGLDLALAAYETRVFLGPRIVRGDRYARLAEHVGHGPVDSVDGALEAPVAEPARDAVVALLDPGALRRDAGAALGLAEAAVEPTLSAEGVRAATHLASIGAVLGRTDRASEAAAVLVLRLRACIGLVRRGRMAVAGPTESAVAKWLGADRGRWATMLGWMYAEAVNDVSGGDGSELGLDGALGEAVRALGASDAQVWRAVELVRTMRAVPVPALKGSPDLDGWLDSAPVREATGRNEWQGEVFVDADAFAEVLDAVVARDAVLALADGPDDAVAPLDHLVESATNLRAALESRGWRVAPDATDADARPEPYQQPTAEPEPDHDPDAAVDADSTDPGAAADHDATDAEPTDRDDDHEAVPGADQHDDGDGHSDSVALPDADAAVDADLAADEASETT